MGKLRNAGRKEVMKIKLMVIMMITFVTNAIDSNPIHDPCSDTKVQKWDGFTFGFAFSSKESFYDSNQVQLSPCDSRLQLVNQAQLAIFRPRIDEISLLTINNTFNPVCRFLNGLITLMNVMFW